VPADAAVAADLRVEPGDPVMVMEKLFLEDATPVVLTVNRIPASIISGEVTPADDEPIYAFLEAHCDRHLTYYLSEIVPLNLSRRHARLLDVPAGRPTVSFEEIGFDQDNEPVVRATSYFRDDLLRFRLIRRKSGA
jgi:GntR family transcriptional regulator